MTCYATVIHVGSVMTRIGRDADDCLVYVALESTVKIIGRRIDADVPEVLSCLECGGHDGDDCGRSVSV